MHQKCPRKSCQNNAIITSFGVLPCANCNRRTRFGKREKPPEFYTQSRQDRIQQQRDRHGADFVQPYLRDKINPDFAKLYPDRAEECFTKEELESL